MGMKLLVFPVSCTPQFLNKDSHWIFHPVRENPAQIRRKIGNI